MRRLIVISMLWLGLLGLAEPLLACAIDTPSSACCSSDIQASCEQVSDWNTIPADAGLCCALAPVGQPRTVVIKKSDANPRHEASGGADIALITSRMNGQDLPLARLASDHRITHSAQSFGAQTYLRTGRLRL